MLIVNSVWAISDVEELLRLRSIDKSPEVLLNEIDTMRKEKTLPDYKLDYLDCYAYYYMARHSIAYRYAMSAFKSKEIKADTALFYRTLIMLAETAVLSYRIEESATIISTGMDYANMRHDKTLKANMLYAQGLMFRKIDNLRESYDKFNEAIEILDNYSDVGSLLRKSQIMSYVCYAYISDNKLEEAWRVAIKIKYLLAQIETLGANKSLIDKQEAGLYSKVAYLAQKQGRVILANEYYEMFAATDYSKTGLGLLSINDYLLEVGRYNDVIENNKKFFVDVHLDDAVSVIYQKTLDQSAQAYSHVGNYQMAYQALCKLNEIKERHRLEIDRQFVLDNNQTSKLLQYKLDLEKAEDVMDKRYNMIVFFGMTSCLLLLMFCWVVYDRKRINSKNKQITALLVELRDIEDSTGQTREQHINRNLPNSELFIKFDNNVRKNRLYLNYQMQRDDFARLMGVDRNKFAAIIKEFTGGNLNSYLNDMRLEYSLYLLKNNPEMSIQEVGEASALPSSTTFYRLFKEKYEISPKVFREQLP